MRCFQVRAMMKILVYHSRVGLPFYPRPPPAVRTYVPRHRGSLAAARRGALQATGPNCCGPFFFSFFFRFCSSPLVTRRATDPGVGNCRCCCCCCCRCCCSCGSHQTVLSTPRNQYTQQSPSRFSVLARYKLFKLWSKIVILL